MNLIRMSYFLQVGTWKAEYCNATHKHFVFTVISTSVPQNFLLNRAGMSFTIGSMISAGTHWVELSVELCTQVSHFKLYFFGGSTSSKEAESEVSPV